MADDFVSVDQAPLYQEEQGAAVFYHLLWGDGVDVVERRSERSRVRARHRTQTGWVDNDSLGGEPLLELYFIDVGQGDGILIRTPSGRHLVIDGGYPRHAQDTGKSAADFIDWKFFEDYAADEIVIDAMVASHNDADHYGGLWDLLNVAQSGQLDAAAVKVKAFYHAGLAWWHKPSSSSRWLGPHVKDDGLAVYTQLMGDRPEVEAALVDGAEPRLQGWWARFMRAVAAAGWTDGGPTEIRRLDSTDQFLPEFEPGTPGEPAIAVLGPVPFEVNGLSGIRRFKGGDSKNTNGNGMVLRLDHGRVRILLTGDLNAQAHRRYLDDYSMTRPVFQCDVAKACHHGSEDVSYEFLQAMQPAVTVICSGDNERHDHPRPNIVAASATTGYIELGKDELISPLIYSTELARSVSLGDPFQLEERDSDDQTTRVLSDSPFERSVLSFRETKPGSFGAKVKQRRLDKALVVAGLIYGLVNVRTDGDRILCAVRNEGDGSWQVRRLHSRF